MSERRRRRVVWLLDVGERVLMGLIGALGVGLLGGPDWAGFIAFWLSGLVTGAEQQATKHPARPVSSRPTQDEPQ